MNFEGKTILVTGGTGSFGKTFVHRVLTGELGTPRKVIVLSRDEAKQHEMRLDYLHRRVSTDDAIYSNFLNVLEFRIGDVRAFDDVCSAVKHADIVVNAAALKQVPTCEYFPIQALQTDGGGEFLGEFGAKVAQLGLVQYWNRPNYPQGNGRIERSFGTDEREFWQVEELPGDLAGLRAALAAWDHVYHTERPHQALGYRTPDQFYQEWLATHPKPAPSTERRVVSDMS